MAQTVFIASDGTGRTCDQLVKSALVQFDDHSAELVVRPGVRTARQVRAVVEEAAQAKGIIFFTLVSPTARQRMKEAAAERFVEAVDVLGPVLSGLNSIIHRSPRATPGLYYDSEREHFDRMDAIDYTLKHDDGQRVGELKQADIVLVGVSRASKSSTCFYLAYRGIRAANVPLFGHAEPPAELARLVRSRVIGLHVNCQRLRAIRQARLDAFGGTEVDAYVNPKALSEEVRAAQDQMSRFGWRCIDVSYMAIEEIAKRVVLHMEEHRLRRRPRRPRAAKT